jgi:cellulose synthase/poly-beta-1,6-N-acetylglucosamine synthase-like glycosyltransferase
VPPFVSIVMPCFNERPYIEGCLRGVQAQDYPRDAMEILVADGMSTDGTRAILERLCAEDPRIRVIDNPARYQAPGLNEAIRASRGEVIIRMDVHADYARDYVTESVRVLEETGADNAGGAARPRADTAFERALCVALGSPLAVGGAHYRRPDCEGFVDTVFNGAFRRRVFETVGLYDPGAITNEDAELNTRLRAAGGRVYLSRRIVVEYTPRGSFRSLAKQYLKYGMGRARTVLKHRQISPRAAAPFLFVVTGSITSAVFPVGAAVGGALYALATGAEAARVSLRAGQPGVFPIVWLIFPVIQVSHGIGFAVGLVRHATRPDWREPERLAPLDTAGRRARSSGAN